MSPLSSSAIIGPDDLYRSILYRMYLQVALGDSSPEALAAQISCQYICYGRGWRTWDTSLRSGYSHSMDCCLPSPVVTSTMNHAPSWRGIPLAG